MSKFVIEVVNAKKDGPVYLTPGVLTESQAIDEKTGKPYTVKAVSVPCAGLLILTPNTLDEETRIQITAEQFRNYSHDLECFSEGIKGCPRDIRLDVRDVETGERERVRFADALKVVEAGLNDDRAALDNQNAQAAELEKLASDLDEDDVAEETPEA